MVASAHDIAVQNADGVTIYYNYINNGTELEVTNVGAIYTNIYYTGNIIIPDEVTYMNRTRKVTSIGKRAFSDCSELTSVTIPNSVTSIGQSAFYGCISLTKVIVPDIAAWCGIEFGVGYANPLIHAHHLYSDENTEIKDLVIPNGVTSIGDYAFHYCSGLTSVTIPSSVTSIGGRAFYGWNLPVVISLIENPFTIFSSTFSQNTFYNATLYVPAGTINKYKATEGWKNFLFIEEGNPTGLNVVENTKDNNTTIYDLNGVRLSEPKKDINIINGKKYVRK